MTSPRAALGRALDEWRWWLPLGLALPLLAVVLVPVLPTHDAPKTLYASHVWAHAHEAGYAAEFERGSPVTNLGFAFVYAALERILPWRAAYQLTWALVITLLPLALLRLARAFDERRAPIALIASAAAFHWSIHMGFVNYAASLGVGLFGMAIAIEAPRWSVRRELAVYGFVLVAALCHPVGAQLSALGVFVCRALRTGRGRILRELGAVVVGASPALFVTLVSRDALETAQQRGLIGSESWRLTAGEVLESPLRYFLSGPLWRSLPVVALAGVGAAVAVASIVRRRADARLAAVVAVAAVGVAGAAVAPMHSSTWEFMQPRFIPIAVFTSLALLPIERLGVAWRRGFTASALGLAALSNLWVADLHRTFWREHQDLLAGFGRDVEPGRTLLPVVALPDVARPPRNDQTRPVAEALFLLNVGQLYGVERDAIVPYTFSLLADIHLIESKVERLVRVPKRDYGVFFAPNADPDRRRAELVRLGTFGTTFDDVLFYGDASDVDALVALGYHVEVRRRGFFLGQFEGCPATISVTEARGDEVVHVGWTPSDRVVHSFPMERPGAHTLKVERGSCEGLWLRVEGEGSPRCAGSATDGLFAARPRTREMRCSLRR